MQTNKGAFWAGIFVCVVVAVLIGYGAIMFTVARWLFVTSFVLFLLAIFLFRQAFTKENRQTIENFTQALREAGVATPEDWKTDISKKVLNFPLTFGRSLKQAVQNVVPTLSNDSKLVQESIQNVFDGFQEIHDYLEVISASGDAQAEGMQNITEEMQGVGTLLNSLNETVKDVTANAWQTSRSAEEGHRVADDAISLLLRIHEVMSFASKAVQNLGLRSKEIGEIVSLIEDIAAQTNLLALNAAIEAARAGEHGRGFAVVAAEVNKLAGNSTTAAKRIAQTVRQIHKETEDTAATMQENIDQVSKQAKSVNAVADSLRAIVATTEKTAQELTELDSLVTKIKSSNMSVVNHVNEISDFSKDVKAMLDQIDFVALERSRVGTELADLSKKQVQRCDELQKLTE